MTKEGIIQKVLKKAYEDIKYYTERDCLVNASTICNNIEMELIAEIQKPEFRISYRTSDGVIRIRDLIGDIE